MQLENRGIAVTILTTHNQFMKKLKIETGTDNKILREISKPVKKIDKQLLKFIKEMEFTLDNSNAVGLAAPQVGENIRVLIAKFNHGTDHEVNVPMINPEIVWASEEMDIDEEGCLSIPDYFNKVVRHSEIIVKFLDVKNREQMLKLSGFNGRVVQHEIDHLDGILFVDKMVEEVEANLAMRQNHDEHLSI